MSLSDDSGDTHDGSHDRDTDIEHTGEHKAVQDIKEEPAPKDSHGTGRISIALGEAPAQPKKTSAPIAYSTGKIPRQSDLPGQDDAEDTSSHRAIDAIDASLSGRIGSSRGSSSNLSDSSTGLRNASSSLRGASSSSRGSSSSSREPSRSATGAFHRVYGASSSTSSIRRESDCVRSGYISPASTGQIRIPRRSFDTIDPVQEDHEAIQEMLPPRPKDSSRTHSSWHRVTSFGVKRHDSTRTSSTDRSGRISSRSGRIFVSDSDDDHLETSRDSRSSRGSSSRRSSGTSRSGRLYNHLDTDEFEYAEYGEHDRTLRSASRRSRSTRGQSSSASRGGDIVAGILSALADLIRPDEMVGNRPYSHGQHRGHRHTSKLAVIAAVAAVAVVFVVGSGVLNPQSDSTSNQQAAETQTQDSQTQEGATTDTQNNGATTIEAKSPAYTVQPTDLGSLSSSKSLTPFSVNSASTEAPSIDETAKTSINSAIEAIENTDATVGIVFIDLQSGKGIEYNSGLKVYGASSFKGPFVTYMCQKLVESGQLKLSSSIKDEIEPAILESDNSSYKRLRNSYSFGLSSWLSGMGLPTSLASDTYYPHYTAQQSATLWLNAYTYMQKDTKTSKWLFNLFKNTNTSYIRSGLSSMNATVYNKAGWIADGSRYQSMCDAGLIEYQGRWYEMSIMTSQPDSEKGGDRIGNLAKALLETAPSIS